MGDQWYEGVTTEDAALPVDWGVLANGYLHESPFVGITCFLVWWVTQDLGKRLDKIHGCLDDLKEELKRIAK